MKLLAAFLTSSKDTFLQTALYEKMYTWTKHKPREKTSYKPESNGAKDYEQLRSTILERVGITSAKATQEV